MAHQPELGPASQEGILERLNRYGGDRAVTEIASIVDLLANEQRQQAVERLAALDARIGGYGIHSRLKADAGGRDPYEGRDRQLYRPIDYVIMHLKHSRVEWCARNIAEMACAHIEGIIKRFVERRKLLERFRPSPLGRLLHNGQVRQALPRPLWEDLLWLNSRVYTHVKHEFGFRDEIDEAEEERKGHLFTVEESLARTVSGRIRC